MSNGSSKECLPVISAIDVQIITKYIDTTVVKKEIVPSVVHDVEKEHIRSF